MDMQTKAAQATRNRRGVMMLPLLAAVAVAAITIIPVVRWCMAFINGTENINAQLEMQSIIQEYYSKVSAASYEELQATIASKGTTWTEDVGGKYTLTVETSEAGKFENALCNLDEAAGAYDRACMKANITLVSKADPSRTVGMQVTRVATLNQLAELADKIEAEGERFADYYTKAEADAQYACPWDYHLVSGKCVACPAPSNWKQYRSGNCTLATCSTGYKANSAKTGCTKITCPSGQHLEGDSCIDDKPTCASDQVIRDENCVSKRLYLHPTSFSGGWPVFTCFAGTLGTDNYNFKITLDKEYEKRFWSNNFSGFICIMPYVERKDDYPDLFYILDVRYALIMIPKTWSGAAISATAPPSPANGVVPCPSTQLLGPTQKIGMEYETNRVIQMTAFTVSSSVYFADIGLSFRDYLQGTGQSTDPRGLSSVPFVFPAQLYRDGYSGVGNCRQVKDSYGSGYHTECGAVSLAGGIYLRGWEYRLGG